MSEEERLTNEERIELEDSIFDAHFSAQKYVEDQRDLYHKLLEVSVTDAVEFIEMLGDKVKNDEMAESYKLHLFVPLHLLTLLEERQENNEFEKE